LNCQSENVKSDRRSKRDGRKGKPHRLLPFRADYLTRGRESGSRHFVGVAKNDRRRANKEAGFETVLLETHQLPNPRLEPLARHRTNLQAKTAQYSPDEIPIL
jgi:hypothetical protein